MTEETTVFSVEDKMDEMVSQMTNLMNEMKTMVTEMKVVKKEYLKNKKLLVQKPKKKMNTGGKPSGFSKPVPLTPELTSFLEVKKDEKKLSRTEVTNC